jgi:hypothetical protein
MIPFWINLTGNDLLIRDDSSQGWNDSPNCSVNLSPSKLTWEELQEETESIIIVDETIFISHPERMDLAMVPEIRDEKGRIPFLIGRRDRLCRMCQSVVHRSSSGLPSKSFTNEIFVSINKA